MTRPVLLPLLACLTVGAAGCGKKPAAEDSVLDRRRTDLRDKSPRVRRDAVAAIGKAATPDAVPDLVGMLNDPDDGVRTEAANALWAVGRDARGAAPDLIRALQHDKHADVRMGAAGALGEMSPDSVACVAPLAAALKDKSPGVRLTAAQSLTRFGASAKDAVPALQAALRDPDKNVRMQAAYALAEVGPAAEPAVAALKEATAREKDGNARGAAVQALERIQGKR